MKDRPLSVRLQAFLACYANPRGTPWAFLSLFLPLGSHVPPGDHLVIFKSQLKHELLFPKSQGEMLSAFRHTYYSIHDIILFMSLRERL